MRDALSSPHDGHDIASKDTKCHENFNSKEDSERNLVSLNREIKKLEIQIDDKGNRDSVQDQEGKKEGATEIFYVEKRYCTVCNMEQPFRAKHCKDCDRCIARYDHHCPWLGN